MWMNSASSPYRALSSSATSTTGPHTRLWHRRGVANTSTTGFLPTTSAKSCSCMVEGGTRVSIDSRSPPASASVGVWINGALSRGPGTGSSRRTVTWGSAEVAATSRPFIRAMPMRSYLPGSSKGMSATYTDLAASGSAADDWLRNWGLTSSDS
jgi:hypothetical protein